MRYRFPLSTAVVTIIVSLCALPWLAPPAAGQCELRWRQLSGPGGLPALRGWRIVADWAGGALYAVEPNSLPSALNGRVWRTDGRGWRNIGPRTDVPWPTFSVAFDSARGRLVSVQPQQNAGAFMDVWEWNGSAWFAVPNAPDAPTPSSRTDAAIAYDSVRGVTLLFGGREGHISPINDTWAWNGERWALLDAGGAGPTRPTPRYQAALVEDPGRGVVVLSGGVANSHLLDTWEWDGAAWTMRSGSGPHFADSRLTFDPASNRLVGLGGETPAAPVRSLRSWDGAAWTTIEGSETADRPGATLVADPRSGRLSLVGGSNNHVAYEQDIEWDGEQWGDVDHGPRPRRVQAAYDIGRRVLVVTEGTADVAFRSVWELSDDSWTRRPGSELTNPSSGPAWFFPPLGRVLTMGSVPGMPVQMPVYAWDGMQWTQVPQPGGSPTPEWRRAHAVAYDSGRSVAVLFGGQGPFGHFLNQTWEFDGETWSHIAASTPPSARHGHAMVYDALRGRTLVFGGHALGGYSRELWSYDGGARSWTRVADSGPSPRTLGGMAYDSHRGVAILFGGLTQPDTPSGGLWQWDGSAWAILDAPGPRPSARAAAAFVYDPARRATVLHGGSTFSLIGGMYPYLADTWILHRAADHNVDGDINSADLSHFIETWLRSLQDHTLDADFDLSGDINSGDISAFIDAWLAAVANGC